MWIPENTYINICKVAQEIYKNHYQEDRLNIISVGTAYRPMNCSYMLEIPEEYRAQGFSYYDNVVCDAIYTLYKYEQSRITPGDILQIMTMDEKARFYYTKGTVQKREKRLRESLKKLMNTRIVIDFREEVRLRELIDESGNLLEGLAGGALLPLEEAEEGKAYYFQEGRTLPVYQYAETIKQIIRVPKELISPYGVLEKLEFSSTDEVIQLKRILIQRLEIMGNTRNNTNGQRIRYYGNGKEDGILPLIGIRKENFSMESTVSAKTGREKIESRGWKNKVHDVDKKVCQILDAYKECGYIEDYTQLRNGARGLVRGIEILGKVNRFSPRT